MSNELSHVISTMRQDLQRGRMDYESQVIFDTHFVCCTIEPDETGSLIVTPVWRGVERPTPTCWSLKATHLKLAQRLQQAVVSGRAFVRVQVRTDTYGKTYIDTTSQILGRTMNADLRKLGF